MHSKTEAQDFQAIRKAMKKQQMMVGHIQIEKKKKVGCFLNAEVIFSLFYVMLQLMVNPLEKSTWAKIFFPSVFFFPKIAC